MRSRLNSRLMIPPAAGLPTVSVDAAAGAMPAEPAQSSVTSSQLFDRPTRRQFLASTSALAAGLGSGAAAFRRQPARRRIAAIVTVYTHNSHADVIVSRLLQTYTLDDQGPRPNLELVSVYA